MRALRAAARRRARLGRAIAACGAPVAMALILGACTAAPPVVPAAVPGAAPPSPVPPTLSVPTTTASPARLAEPDLSCINGGRPVAPLSPMPTPGDMPAGSTMRQIQNRGYLIVGVDQDSYDFGYPNPTLPTPSAGREYEGFDIDVLHAISQAIFNSPNDIRYVPVSQEYRLGAADQGVVDVVADSLTITCDRADQVAFSADYFDANQELLVNRDDDSVSVSRNAAGVPQIEGLRDRKVCTVGTTTSITNLAVFQRQSGLRIVLAGNWSDCLLMLQQGTVAAVTTDDTILDGMLAEDPYLKIVDGIFSYEPHGLAFPQEVGGAGSAANTQFIGFVDGVLAEIESSDHSAIACPEQLQSTDTSCWAALYRIWIQPRSGTPAPTPPSLTRYP